MNRRTSMMVTSASLLVLAAAAVPAAAAAADTAPANTVGEIVITGIRASLALRLLRLC